MNQDNRVLSGLLARLLKQSDHALQHRDVALFAVSYLSDFNLKVSGALHSKLLAGIQEYLHDYDLKELSHLALNVCQQPNFQGDTQIQEQIKKRIHQLLAREETEVDQAVSERLALFDSDFKLDADRTRKTLEDIETGSNLVELIQQDMLADREVQQNQIVCGGRLKASFVVDSEYIIEIEENATVNFRKGDKLQMMSRGRQAEALAKAHGFKGYIGVSLLEMEYHHNEAEYLLKVLAPLYPATLK